MRSAAWRAPAFIRWAAISAADNSRGPASMAAGNSSMAASRDRIRSQAPDRGLVQGHIRRGRHRGQSRILQDHHPGPILPARRRLRCLRRIGEADGMSTRSRRPLPLA
ncbi:hypothetical protein PSAC2689_240003 [Paraburkholderia sacchari]